jgi:hypothetical protein
MNFIRPLRCAFRFPSYPQRMEREGGLRPGKQGQPSLRGGTRLTVTFCVDEEVSLALRPSGTDRPDEDNSRGEAGIAADVRQRRGLKAVRPMHLFRVWWCSS